MDRSAREWWDHVERRELVVQECRACEAVQHPPGPLCRSCRSTDLHWVSSPGTGELVSFTEVHRTTYAEWQAAAPYWIAVVRLAPAAHMIANLLHVTADRPPAAGQRVTVTFHEHAGRTLPAFELASAEESR